MYLRTSYTIQEQEIIIRYGYITRAYTYSDLFAFQKVDQALDLIYGFSAKRIALFLYNKDSNKRTVFGVTPKDEEGFIRALTEKSAIEITPPLPDTQNFIDVYSAGATSSQRKAARRRFFTSLLSGYEQETLKGESPYEFMERQRKAHEEWEAMKELQTQDKTAEKQEKTEKWTIPKYFIQKMKDR